jgi:acyl-CoA thioesterase
MTGAAPEAPSPLLESLGDGRMIEFIAGENRVVMEFTGKPEFCHSGDVIQGGFVTGWIDSAMAHAAMLATEGALAPATLEIKVNFFRATHPGKVRVEGWIERLGRSIAFLEGRVLTPDGDVLATATSTVKLVPTQRDAKVSG